MEEVKFTIKINGIEGSRDHTITWENKYKPNGVEMVIDKKGDMNLMPDVQDNVRTTVYKFVRDGSNETSHILVSKEHEEEGRLESMSFFVKPEKDMNKTIMEIFG